MPQDRRAEHASVGAAGCATRAIRVRRRLAVVLCIAVGAAAGNLPAAAATPGGATSNRAASEEAIRAIPWNQLARPERAAVQRVVQGASIYRRLPVRVIDCDPDMFTFLIRHPEVVVETWRLMGITRASLDRLADGAYRGTDGAGTVGQVRFVYSDWGPEARNVAVLYAEGAYEGKPLVRPVKAESVMLLRSRSVREENGRHYVTVRVDSFIRIERLDVELVAKTVQPWIAKTADQNFVETLTFVSNFSRTAEKNPRGMQRLAARLPGVDEPTRHELVQLCLQTADRYAQQAEVTQARRMGSAGPALVARTR